MKLVGWLIVVCLQVFLFKINGLNKLTSVSHSFHQWLMDVLHSHPSSLNWFYGAILFGEDRGFRQKPEMDTFVVLGIYHIVVVSGSHLIMLQGLLEKILKRFPQRIVNIFIGLFLLAFTMANQWQAACFRAYLAWCLRKFENRFVNDFDLQIVATLFCLLIQPALVHSLSFQLSCAASTGISVAQSLNSKSRLLVPVFCVVLTAPLVFSVQPCLSWLIIPINILALPFIEIILLPLSLVSFFLPFLKTLTEPVLNLLFKVLMEIARYQNPSLCFPTEGGKNWGIVYIAVLYLCWRFCLPYFLRAEFKKNQAQF